MVITLVSAHARAVAPSPVTAPHIQTDTYGDDDDSDDDDGDDDDGDDGSLLWQLRYNHSHPETMRCFVIRKR